LIEVDELTKFYGNYQALNKISFTVNKGEILGFLGPNGAGKSTTMKIITGFLSPTEGTVRIDGIDVVENSLETRKLIGYLPEHPPLYLDMSVYNYLQFCGRIKGVSSKRLKSSIDSVVEKCGLTKYYKKQCHALSKGYRQRVGIAQAMIHEPAVLILDEPTIGLDPIQIVEIREMIKAFGGDHTVILSTHILPEVDMTCERVIIINEGKVITEGSTFNLCDNVLDNSQIALVIHGNGRELRERIGAIEGVTDVVTEPGEPGTEKIVVSAASGNDLRPQLARLAVESNNELLELRTISLSLEEIFIKVTTKQPEMTLS